MKRNNQTPSAFLVIVLFLILIISSTNYGQSVNTQYVYDENGRLKMVILPSGETSIYQYDTAGNILSITKQANPVVTVTSFFPQLGFPGTQVTIHGAAFDLNPQNNVVKFNGVQANIISTNLTKLVAVVPVGATSGTVSVTTSNGTGFSKNSFSVSTTVLINSLAPTLADVGTPIVINGDGFNIVNQAGNAVKFNDTLTNSTTAEINSLQVNIPENATSGKVSVTTPWGSATGSQDLFIPPVPFNVSNVQVTGRLQILQTRNVALSDNSKIALLLFEGQAGNLANFSLQNIQTETLIKIISPSGVTVFERTVFPSNTNFTTPNLPQNGTYTVLLNMVTAGSLNILMDEFIPLDIGGNAVEVAFTAQNQTKRLVFNGTAGQEISLNIFNSNTLGNFRIISPTGATVVSPISFGSNFYDSSVSRKIVLPENGLYSILVTGLIIGRASFIGFNETYQTANIAHNTPQALQVNSFGQNFLFTFNATAGKRISLRFTDSNLSGLQINILDSNSVVVGSYLQFTNEPTGFIETFDVTQNQTYTVLVNPIGRASGTINVALYEFLNLTETLEIEGPSKTVSIQFPGQDADITFAAEAGNSTGLTISNVSQLPYKISVCYSIDCVIYETDVATEEKFFELPELPVSETYKIKFNPQGGITPNATFKLGRPPEINQTLTLDAPPLNLVFGGQNAHLSFNGTAGQRIFIKFGEVSFSPRFEIRQPDGEVLIEGSAFTNLGHDLHVLPVNGTYTIFINNINVEAGTLQISALSSARLISGHLTNVDFLTPNRTADLTYQANSPGPVGLIIPSPSPDVGLANNRNRENKEKAKTTNVSQPSNNLVNTQIRDGNIQVLRPDGTTLTEFDLGSFFVLIDLPSANIFTFRVAPVADTTGFVQLRILEEAGNTILQTKPMKQFENHPDLKTINNRNKETQGDKK